MKQSQVEEIVTNIALVGFALSFPESTVRTSLIGGYFLLCIIGLWLEIKKEKLK